MAQTITNLGNLIKGKNGKNYYKLSDGSLAFVPKDVAAEWDNIHSLVVDVVKRRTLNETTGEYDGEEIERTEATTFVTFSKAAKQKRFDMEILSISKEFSLDAEDVLKYQGMAI